MFSLFLKILIKLILFLILGCEGLIKIVIVSINVISIKKVIFLEMLDNFFVLLGSWLG